MDFAAALAPASCLNNEEVLERHAPVKALCEVCEVISELHWLGVQLAVGPAAKHWNLGSRVGVAVVTVAGILEVLELNALLGRSCVDVGRDSRRELNLAAA